MSRFFAGGYEDSGSDENVYEDYEETHGGPKKDWIGPSKASLQQLDRVKPAATVYNLGLRDPSDLKPGRGKTPLVSAHDQLSDLHAEPPLSTVSYQKAAWGSENSIPEVLKNAAQAGTRPSSAKSGSVAKQSLSKKLRPQSAKDPLCPNGKIKAAKLGVKGQKFDPSDRYARNVLPPTGTPLGWAGPPAGLCDPSDDSAIDSVQAVNAGKHAPVPPPPNTSPEPRDSEDPPGLEAVPESPPPSPGLHLSFSLPSADADSTDEPDTGRLLAEADQYIKTKKEVQKIRYFKADSMVPGKIGESLKTSITQLQDNQTKTTETSAPADLEKESENSQEREAEQSEEELNENKNDNRVPDHENETMDRDEVVGDGNDTDQSLHLDLTNMDDGTIIGKPLPPSNGFDLKYLGPTATKQERKNRNHPIFLTPHKKQKNAGSHQPPSHNHQRPQSAKYEDSAADSKPSRSATGVDKPMRPTTAKVRGEKSSPRAAATRTGVHIREDCNTTVDITPRNLGRKVMTGKLSKKQRSPLDFTDLEVKSESLVTEQGGDDFAEDVAPKVEIAAASVKVQTQHSAGVRPSTPAAAPISVVYDDDDDEDSVKAYGKKKKKCRRPVKEKDLVTMVSNVNLSDEEDDPSKEVNIEIRDAKGDIQLSRPSSALSNGERNYYDIARKQSKAVKKDNNSNLEEKENFITVTTKLILFDTEKPMESVVKKILEAPQAKEKVAVTSPEKLPPRPRSSCRPRSAKLSKSELHSVAPEVSLAPVSRTDGDNEENEGGFTCSAGDPEDLERPWSRAGFVDMESNQAGEGSDDEKGCNDKEAVQHGVKHRPPSGKRRPLSATLKTVNKSTPTSERQKTKEPLLAKRRPVSASSAVAHSPSNADIHRANAAAQALRSQREETAKVGSQFNQTQRHYASYSRSSRHGRARSASLTLKPVQIVSKNPDFEVVDSEEMKECKEMQNRLACYGIDVKPETLERALFPPSGKTLYYQVDAELPKSFSTGLLSHPRYWLPEEHRKLKLAEKKLALAELSLWRQKKEEEKKARLAAGKDKVSKKGKKKGKKKLRRSQSIC